MRNKLTWQAALTTGIRIMDLDHQGLFSVVDKLRLLNETGGGSRQMSATIGALQLYVDEHFEREERFLYRVNYPQLKEHLEAHRHFSRAIKGLAALHDEAPKSIDVEKVLDFLEHWLIDHISNQDMGYVPYLKGEKHADPTVAGNPAVTIKTVEIPVPAEKSAMIRNLVAILSAGGQTANQLEEALSQLTEQAQTDEIAEARRLFSR